MKIKTKKRLSFLFWGVGFGCLLLGLSWYVADKYALLQKEPVPAEQDLHEWITIIEKKEPTPEEKIPLPEVSEEELAFRSRAREVLRSFPKKSVLQEAGRDLHKPPPELVEAGAELGAIEDLLDRNPKLFREGLKFYKDCALEEGILTSLRSLCLHNLKARAKAAGFQDRIRWQIFPAHLHRLADKLND